MKIKRSARKKNSVSGHSARRRSAALLLIFSLTISGVLYLSAYTTSSALDGANVTENETPAEAETNFTDTITDESEMIPATEARPTDTASEENATLPETETKPTDTAAKESETPTEAESNTANMPAKESETSAETEAESKSELNLKSETESDSETSAASYRTMALTTLQQAEFDAVFSNGTIPPEKFTAEKGGQAITLPSEWTGLPSGSLYGSDGTLLSSLFPKIEGCHIVNATVHSTAIRHIGTLTAEISGREMTFIYYSTDPELNEQSVTVLDEKDVITLHYEEDEYEISYTVSGASGFSVEELFGKNRPRKTQRHSYTLNVTVPRGYTGIVYVNNSYRIPDGDYGFLSLGADPTYEATATGAEISVQKPPRFFSRSGSYTYTDVRSAQHVNIVLSKRGSFTDKYYFDPHFWLQTGDAEKRIASDVKDAVQITDISADGRYSYTWYFNTVVIPNVWQTYMLRTLEINGEAIAVPFFESVENNNPNVSAETTLSTGTRVRLTLTRVEKDWLTPLSGVPFNSYLRYYRLDVENAAESLTITGGAVTTAVSQQNVLRTASGVKVQYAIRQSANTSQWTDKQQGDITPASTLPSDGELGYRRYSTGTDKKFEGNVRFRLLPGFHTSEDMAVFRNSSGTPIRLDAYAGPDSEGWYYLKLNPSTTDAIHPTSLEIKAAPNRYAVRYLPGDPGDGQVEHMPEFGVSGSALPPHTDSNNGSFYLLNGASANSDTMVPIAGAPTNNATVPAAFLSWALTDSDGKPVPSASGSISFSADGAASLRSLMDYAIYDSSLDVWIINLTAQWEDNLFRYFIDLQWDTPDGMAHVKSNAAVVSTASGAQREGQKLRFVLSKDADVITDFLKDHPGYRLADDNDQLFYVADNEHVTIKFEQISAELSVAKRLLDENMEEVPSVREFPINLTLSYPEGVLAPDGADLSGQPLDADYDGDYPYTVTDVSGQASSKTLTLVGGRGSFSLKSGETASFPQLPADISYDIKEESSEDFTVEYAGKSGMLHASASAGATVANRRNVSLTIRKLVAGGSAEPGKKWNFTVTMKDGEENTETNSFTLGHNESFVLKGWPAGTTYTVTETDANQDGYKTVITGAETATGGAATGVLRDAEAANGITVTYTNTNASGNLILSKRQLVNGKDVGERADVQAGDTVTYELTLTNSDTTPVENIDLTDEIPSGLLLDESSISGEGRKTGNTVVWTFPTLDAQQEKTVRFCVTVPSASGSTATIWTNQALARSDDGLEEPGSPGMTLNILSNPVTLQLKKSGDTPQTEPSSEKKPESEKQSESENQSESETESLSESESESETRSESEKQSESKSPAAPKTGDNTPVLPWLSATLLALFCLELILHYRKKI